MSFYNVQQARMQRLMAWMQRYIDNRTLPALVLYALLAISMSMNVLMFLSIFSAHFIPYLILTTTVSLLCWLAIVWLCWPKRSENLLMRFGRFCYRKDGELRPKPLSKRREIWLSLLIGIGPFILGGGLYLTAHWYHRSFGEIPPLLIQPISALFVVPYCIALARIKNQADISWINIFALLYTAYGILTLAGGVSLSCTDRWLSLFLNGSLPLLTCILLSLLIGHAINRVALRRIRRLSNTMLTEGGEM